MVEIKIRNGVKWFFGDNYVVLNGGVLGVIWLLSHDIGVTRKGIHETAYDLLTSGI